MMLKIYEIIWTFIATIAGVLFLTGEFTQITAVLFGFICFGMVFMGMMTVLPATIEHPVPPVELTPNLEVKPKFSDLIAMKQLPIRRRL